MQMIPQELSALMALEQGVRQGTVSPVTPQGTPTVAAQLAGAAQQQMAPQMAQPMPAGVRDIAQQAGLGAQIQAMQQQQAQQQAMNPQAVAQMAAQMLQQNMNRGIASAPGADSVRMAQGGIVGYADGSRRPIREYMPQGSEDIPIGPSDSESDQRPARDPFGSALLDVLGLPLNIIRKLTTHGGASLTPNYDEMRRGTPVRETRVSPEAAEAARFTQDTPYAPGGRPAVAQAPDRVAPPRPPAATPGGGIAAIVPNSAEDFRRRALEDVERISTTPPTGQAIGAAAQRQAEARKEYLRSQGIDPDYLTKEQAAAEERFKARTAYTDELAAELKKRQEELAQRRAGVGGVPQGVIDFLLNARGFKGQGLGQIMRSGVEGLQVGESAARQEAAKMREENMRIREMRFSYEDASVREKQALQNARNATAMGDWNTANANILEAQKEQNKKYALTAEMKGKFAHDVSQEEMKRQELKMRYSELQSNKDGQRLLAAQQRVDSAMQLREKVYEKAKQFMGMPEKDLESAPMLKQMRDNALSELARIDREVLEPAKQLRDSLQERVLGIKMPKSSQQETQAPAPGTIMNGYRFKGGNPADKANWERI